MYRALVGATTLNGNRTGLENFISICYTYANVNGTNLILILFLALDANKVGSSFKNMAILSL